MTPEVKTAFEMYEHLYVEINNRKPINIPDIEPIPDITERDKELLALHRAKLQMLISVENNQIAKEASKSSEQLGKKIFWLNIAMALLTVVVAFSAVIELFQ